MNSQQVNGYYNQNQQNQINNGISSNSRKVLYIAVAVAALFVAAISGTFAYFTASASNNTTINGTLAATTLSLAVTKLDNASAANGTNLIPMDTTTYANLNTALGSSCVDSNGYTACQVYRIAITVPANSPQIAITGTVNIAANSGSAMPNLTYALLRAQDTGTTAATVSGLTTSATYYSAKATLGNDLTFTSIDLTSNPSNGYLAATTTATATYNYYVIVWLEDTGSAQNDTDKGSFTGTVNVNSASGNITATFSS
jgi:hypothetical protein